MHLNSKFLTESADKNVKICQYLVKIIVKVQYSLLFWATMYVGWPTN